MSAGSGFPLAPDAALTLGIASTAMPFARTPDAQVERWLRVLRLNGEVGLALQSLGVSEGPLAKSDVGGWAASPSGPNAGADAADASDGAASERDAVTLVTEHAVRIAEQRRATELATTDVLVAVMHVYGEEFDRALRVHGTDRNELLEQLDLSASTS
jgi:hypothetical protein